MKTTKPQALIFDVFGSLVDWRTGVAEFCKPVFEQKSISFNPYEFASLWRAEYQPAMERIRNGNRGYVALDVLHRENLDEVLEATGLTENFNLDERDALNKAWEHLPSWPDVSPGLKKLRENALIAPCSNGSVALMVRLARFADLPWDTIVGAETARDYKPKTEVYNASCKALGLRPDQVMMVAAHNDDLAAARDAGLMTGFFPRLTEHGPDQTTDLEAAEEWDFIGKDTLELAAHLELFTS